MNKSKTNSSSKKKNTYKRNNSKSSAKDSSINNQSNNDSSNQTSKLCTFSYVDYIILASTLAIALGEELSPNDINILASFFAVLSDELALIASVDACNDNDETSVFVPPAPDIAVTSTNKSKKKK